MRTRTRNIPTGAIKVMPKGIDAEIYLYENGGPLALGFGGKRTKPDFHVKFRSAERREQYIKDYLEGQRKRAEMMQERKVARRTLTTPLNIGDILHYSWGYDQTQCEFYQVVSIKGQTCTIREIAGRTVEGSTQSHGMADSRVAVPDHFIGEPMTKLIQAYSGKPYLRMNHGGATLWDGSPMYCSWYA